MNRLMHEKAVRRQSRNFVTCVKYTCANFPCIVVWK